MYQDENNFYHHVYEKDGSEPGQRYDTRPSVDEQLHHYQYGPQTPPVQEAKPVKKNRFRNCLKEKFYC